MTTATLDSMPATLKALGGYSATVEQSASGRVLTVHRVPIFCECERPDKDMLFDRSWIDEAVAAAKLGESEGYLPPLHVKHHDTGDPVRPAGVFRVTGTGQIRFKGAQRLAVFADLIVTDPAAIDDILAGRLPYRSIEVFRRDVAKIDTLALLDHEAPFLELPLLMISKVNQGDSGEVKDFTFRSFATTETSSLVAFCKRGDSASLLFRNEGSEQVMEDKKDEKKDEPTKMEAADGALDIAAVLKAIESGSISVADMDAIVAAIASYHGAQAPAEEEAAPEAAPVMPAGMAMQARETSGPDAVQFAKVSAELEAVKMQLAERERTEKRNSDVAAAVERFAGRAVGSDFKAKLEAFHKANGAVAFSAYVDGLDQYIASPVEKAPATPDASSVETGPLAKFANRGPEVLAFARAKADEWKEAHKRGYTKQPCEAYIEANLAAQRHLAPAGANQN